MNKIDTIKLYLNRCSCLIKLGQHENLINECNKILTHLSKQKNIALINSNLVMMDTVKNWEFLTYIKRAYSQNANGNKHEAIKEYSKAVELKPGDTKIIESINLLKINIR